MSGYTLASGVRGVTQSFLCPICATRQRWKGPRQHPAYTPFCSRAHREQWYDGVLSQIRTHGLRLDVWKLYIFSTHIDEALAIRFQETL